MSNLVKFGIFIALAITFAADNNAKVVEQETISKTVKTLNLNNKIEIIESEKVNKEVVPVDVEKISRIRLQKSMKAKKHATITLREQKNKASYQNEFAGVQQVKEIQQKNVLRKWSSDIDSKLPVVILKNESGEKAVKFPTNNISK
tara:strand:+ start:361 stop:798 length:438 start_codon:yes stop_codon:yes gene_type:complete